MGRRTRNTTNSEFPILVELGLYAAPTKGDGNCLFRALSDQLYGDESRHLEIRQKVVAYVKEHHDHFSAFVGEFGETFDQYVTRLAQDGVYGGHIEIVGFADVYQSPVVIYQAEELYIVEPQNKARASWQKSVHIAYHTWEHYSSVRKLGGPSTGVINIDIPQHKDLPMMSSAVADGSEEEVPEWKVNIVLKSIPDASAERVAMMLRTKGHAEVIEDLLMEQLEDDGEPDPPPVTTTIVNDTAEAPSFAADVATEDRVTSDAANASTAATCEDQAVPTSKPSERSPGQTSDIESSLPSSEAQRKSGRRLEARKRRHEKKERARQKKTKSRSRQEQDARNDSEDDSLPDVKPRRIIHI